MIRHRPSLCIDKGCTAHPLFTESLDIHPDFPSLGIHSLCCQGLDITILLMYMQQVQVARLGGIGRDQATEGIRMVSAQSFLLTSRGTFKPGPVSCRIPQAQAPHSALQQGRNRARRRAMLWQAQCLLQENAIRIRKILRWG